MSDNTQEITNEIFERLDVYLGADMIDRFFNDARERSRN